MDRMNVIAICLDTFRADFALGMAPWAADLPNLERLRRESVVFTNAFGEAYPTIPMRRAYFTGEPSFPWRYAFDTKGMWPTGRGWHKIPPEQPTIAEVLLDQGYMTGLIADTYHMFKPTMNFTRGFASYEFVRGYESDNWKGGVLSASELAPYVREPIRPEEHPVLVQHLLNTRGRVSEADWSVARVFDRATEWVGEQPADRPFFLWVDSFSPHEPWEPPARFIERYMPGYEGKRFIYPVDGPDAFSTEEAEFVRAAYRGYLSFVDERLGRFLEALDRSGHRERTILAVLSDHGTELQEHGRFSKIASHLFAHNTRLVYIIRHPGISEGRELDAFVTSTDLVPTLLNMVGGPSIGSGMSLWPLMQGKRSDTGRDHVVSGWGNFAAVRDRAWNYIVNFEDPKQFEKLYRLDVDPGEQTDVVAAHPREASRMRVRLESVLGGAMPLELPDEVEASLAPVRRLFGAVRMRVGKDSGFV